MIFWPTQYGVKFGIFKAQPMNSRAYLLAVFLLAFFPAMAQVSYRTDQLTTADGLSEGYIYAIHQDKKGFIWIGTHGGLNRYDGYNFKLFQYEPFNAHSLGDNSSFFILEHPVTGKFWIGGSSRLNEFDPETYLNTRYDYPQKQLEFSDGVFINDHQILLACEYDVLLFDVSTKRFTPVALQDDKGQPVAASRIENTAKDRHGHFMILCDKGVFVYDSSSATCRRGAAGLPDFSPLNDKQVFNLIEDRTGSYWLATYSSGLLRYVPAGQSFVSRPLAAGPIQEYPRFDAVYEDSEGIIWAGSGRGLFKIDTRSGIAHTASESFLSNSVLVAEINVISEDRNGVMWIGTVGGGVRKLVRQQTGFKNIQVAGNEGTKRAGTYLMALQYRDSGVWFMNIWDEIGFASVPAGNVSVWGKPVLPASYAWYSEGSLAEADSGSLLALNNQDAYRLHKRGENGVYMEPLPAHAISYIHRKSDGRFLYMVKEEVRENRLSGDTLYGNQLFFDAVNDKAGNVWIGTSRGLIRLDLSNGKLEQFRHDEGDSTSIASDFIYAVEADDGRNMLWMAAYHGGLCSYDMVRHIFHRFDRRDGMADNIVYALEKDKHGNLWFSSNSGISRYEMASGKFVNFTLSDGLLNEEFNRHSSTHDPAGNIYFGGISGIDYFHPDSIRKQKTAPTLAFTGLLVSDREYVPDPLSKNPTITLLPGDGSVTLQFAALEFTDQRNIQYAYRIGNDSVWNALGKQHSLSFANWEPGHHEVFVRSTNTSGEWLDNAISCVVDVRSAWWQTRLFRFGLLLLTGGIGVLILRVYFNRKLEKQRTVLEREQAVEKERTRIATDMHDDLGAGLSRIKFLAENIRLKMTGDDKLQTDLHRISSHSNEMVEKMGEIVWALNQKNDTVADLVVFTRSYAMEYLTGHDISCSVFQPDEFAELAINGEVRRNVFLSVKECLFNIVKHADAREVVIAFIVSHELGIDIHDNGKGIDWERIRPFSNGLENIRRRMQNVGGSALFLSDHGTRVRLVVPLAAAT